MSRYFLLPLLLSSAAVLSADQPVAWFNGVDLTGWKRPHGTWMTVQKLVLDPAQPKAFLAHPGPGILLNSAGNKTVDLLSEKVHGDCELVAEFCIPKGSNSGLYLMGRYEVQILDSFGKEKPGPGDCGGIYERWDAAKNRGFEGVAPRVNACKAPGEWQRFEIVFRAPRFDDNGRKTALARFVKVTLNGELLHENVEVSGPTRSAAFKDEAPQGPLMIQGDHGPVAFRSITVREMVAP